MRRGIMSVVVCSTITLSATVAVAEQLTEAQYKAIMATKAQWDARMNKNGAYANLTNPHKAMAICIDWSKVQGDKIPDSPTMTNAGDDLASVKKGTMDSCVSLEKSYNCKCQLVDVDGKMAQ